jgi:MoaA/NifB/PqqE/SkfB family radical SAM enzyme
MFQGYLFNIDIVDRCNLRCPSCPRGNSTAVVQQRNRMESATLDSILKKAIGECEVKSVDLYNWTEPFLHPRLSEMVRVVKSHNLSCGLSTNLNILPNIDDVMIADPDYILISTSGFTQSVYGQTHKGGDIERVKKNMSELAESRKRTNSSTKIEVKYLLYLGNVDEGVLMKRYAESLGFAFKLSYAGLYPLEKLIAYLTDGAGGTGLSEEERQLTDRIVFPHREVVELAGPYKKLPCLLADEWIMINSSGNVQLCCMVYDESKYTIANYLSTPISEIQRLKKSHWQCPECIELGIAAARSRPLLNLNKPIFEKFKKYYADVGLNMDKVSTLGPIRSRVTNSYRVLRARCASSPWIRRQCVRLRAILNM